MPRKNQPESIGLSATLTIPELEQSKATVLEEELRGPKHISSCPQPLELRPCSGSSFGERLDRGSFVLLDVKHTRQFGDLQ